MVVVCPDEEGEEGRSQARPVYNMTRCCHRNDFLVFINHSLLSGFKLCDIIEAICEVQFSLLVLWVVHAYLKTI